MNLMILGANGLCGTSLVPLVSELFPKLNLILVDPNNESGAKTIKAAPKIEELWHALPAHGLRRGDILIDLTPDLPKIDVMQIADSLGINVINATACEQSRGSLSLVDILDKKLHLAKYQWQASHFVGSGMNPGNVNAMLGLLSSQFGQPLDVTEWEMDSTLPYQWDGEGFATWSPKEFASEWFNESTFEMDGRKVVFADGPPIDNLWQMPNGSAGTLCQHEELIKWAWKYGCKARYLYGYLPAAMQAIEANGRAGLNLPLCRKLKGRTPNGNDYIALQVEFEDGYATGSFSADNSDKRIQIGSNATSYLVACGIVAALDRMIAGAPAGINWPDDHGKEWIEFIVSKKLCKIEFDKKLQSRPTESSQ